MNVLYVEDNPVNITLVQAILESRPHVQLFLATTGRAGLELAQQQPFELILLDLNLPDMRGEEYLQQLRALKNAAQIPVVIVSADVMNQQLTRFHHLAVADFLNKPFDLNQFDQVMDRFLGTSHLA